MESATLKRTQSWLRAGVMACQVGGFSPAWYRFRRATANPEGAQAVLLKRLLRANGGSDFGRLHGFSSIDSIAAYRRQVPRRDFEAYSPWIERIASGEQGVLTTEPVQMMERSGGSTAPNKLIPYTGRLLEEYAAATHPWLFDLFRRCPELRGTRSYWSISPVCRGAERTPGGVPVGFEDDTEYFGPFRRWALRQVMAVPGDVARLPTVDEWRAATCRALLEADDLGLISVWSPTFLTLLMEHISNNLDEFLAQLPPDRARAIGRALNRSGEQGLGKALWPRLAVISCWCDGPSRGFVPGLKRWFPGVAFQPKGLLATEGVVSFPLWGQAGAALAVTSHFLEFVDLERQDEVPLLAHELRRGGRYVPLLTTGGGLYRYHLKDIIRCVGRVGEVPLVRFEGKLDCVSDLCGEKVNVHQVEEGLARAVGATGIHLDFALVSVIHRPSPRYCLYAETAASDGVLERVAALLEDYLLSGHHYRYCRQLGQLGRLEVVRVTQGWGSYQRALLGQGRRLGDIKPTALDVLGIAETVAWEREVQAA